MTRQKLRRFVAGGVATYIGACLVVGVVLGEITVHPPGHGPMLSAEYRARVQQQFHAQVQDVSIAAADGAVLQGWFVQPPHRNGKAVILLHGVTDNRFGISGFGDIFLRRGYSILLPDSRHHGDSGGGIVTYGIFEREDVHRWAIWARQRAPGCTYVFGESMGAAIGIEAAAVTPQLCAIAVESPYSNFRKVSYERLGWLTHMGRPFWITVGAPILEVSILYARLRYGVWMPDADPTVAIEHSNVPALLIAGTADHLIQMHHAQTLEHACGRRCSLWIVPGADHGGAITVAPEEFQQRVSEWFDAHDVLR